MRRHGHCTSSKAYRTELLEALNDFLDVGRLEGLALKWRQWSPWVLVVAAVLMVWESGASLAARFEATRATLKHWWPRRRLGRTYQGLIKALRAATPLLLEELAATLRQRMQEVAGAFWLREGWVAFAVDGSRFECPRTAANEAALGCAGRQKTGPQLFQTTLYHMGTGLPWHWKIGPGTDSERDQLRTMLPVLPWAALLVADAGFVGYELLAAIMASGRHLLIRVGANVTLLQKLGYADVEEDGTVYLWPEKWRRHGQPPLVLRLIVLGRGRRQVFLLTDLPAEQLSVEQAGLLYRMRWGVEVFYRSLKQTLGRRRLCSRAPAQAYCEQTWAMVGLWLLGLLGVSRIVARGHDPLSLSVALALRGIRLALRQGGSGPSVLRTLAYAVKDRYLRRAGKNARAWPHKKKDRPPGAPRIHRADQQQRLEAQEVHAQYRAA